MNGFEKTAGELKMWLQSNKITKLLLPLDIILMFVSLGIICFNLFVIGTPIGVLSSIAYYSFLFSLILCFANNKLMFLYIGLGGYALYNFIYFWKDTINQITAYHGFYFRFYFNYGSIINFLVFGGLAILAFLKSGDLQKFMPKTPSAPTNPPMGE